MVAIIPVCLLTRPKNCCGNPIGRESLQLPQLGRMQTESHFASVRTHTAPLCLPPISSEKQSLRVPMIRKLYLCRRLRCHILRIVLGILSASCTRIQCATPRSLASSRCPWTSLLYAGLISYRGHPTAAKTWCRRPSNSSSFVRSAASTKSLSIKRCVLPFIGGTPFQRMCHRRRHHWRTGRHRNHHRSSTGRHQRRRQAMVQSTSCQSILQT